MSGAAIKAMNPVMHIMLRRYWKNMTKKGMKGADRRIAYKSYKDQLAHSHTHAKARNQIWNRHYGKGPEFSRHRTIKNPTSKEAIKKLRNMASR